MSGERDCAALVYSGVSFWQCYVLSGHGSDYQGHQKSGITKHRNSTYATPRSNESYDRGSLRRRISILVWGCGL